MDRPIETRTISESATISLEFVIQEDTKGRYKIVRDGVTIIDKSTISNTIIIHSTFFLERMECITPTCYAVYT